MRVPLPTRLSLTGILGLALLSATHWARDAIPHPSAPLAFALGVLPNFAASFAMPLILASVLPPISGTRPSRGARRRFLFLLVFTTLGLCGWEVIQTLSNRFVFDLHDIGATILGSIVAHVSYLWLSRTGSDGSTP